MIKSDEYIYVKDAEGYEKAFYDDKLVAIKDPKGNVVTTKEWFTEEDAMNSLKSLSGCAGCRDCVDCVDCVDCDGCVDCDNCINCVYCVECLNCWWCSAVMSTTGRKNKGPVREIR